MKKEIIFLCSMFVVLVVSFAVVRGYKEIVSNLEVIATEAPEIEKCETDKYLCLQYEIEYELKDAAPEKDIFEAFKISFYLEVQEISFRENVIRYNLKYTNLVFEFEPVEKEPGEDESGLDLDYFVDLSFLGVVTDKEANLESEFIKQLENNLKDWFQNIDHKLTHFEIIGIPKLEELIENSIDIY